MSTRAVTAAWCFTEQPSRVHASTAHPPYAHTRKAALTGGPGIAINGPQAQWVYSYDDPSDNRATVAEINQQAMRGVN
jgi:hypothetical protein